MCIKTNNETRCIRAITTNKTIRRLRHGSGDQAEEYGSQDPEESDDDSQPVTTRRKPKKQISLSKKVKPTNRNDQAEKSTSSDLSKSHLKAKPLSLVSQSQSLPIGIESIRSSEVSSPEYNRPNTPPHRIVRNTYNQEIPINENILIMSAKNLASLDESKYLGEFIPLFVKYKESEKNNAFFCANDDVMDIRGESSVARFLSIDQFIKLLSKNQIEKLNYRKTGGTTENGIESFAKPIPDVNASDINEHHYSAEFGHRFFSRALQEFVDIDWKHGSPYKVVDGKNADLLARIWGTGEEIFVGEQAGPPNKPDLAKLSTDSFKLYREMRDCLNVRILRAMGKGDIDYNNRVVFGIFDYLYEIKMLIMWKGGIC
ncbi:179_t:CDS:10 [Acaulospora morrowiae]|uniref:179_t:CDS:1 n=1 Tax=Acaulospora morrowiae TaxID=94023 RepID=A0A9N9CDM4_9GLOM|nr:179_t:CDS:10 [Acaulospora morrowiae]